MLSIKENYLYGKINPRFYTIEKLKKDGATRVIYAPSKSLKIVQRKILDSILVNIKTPKPVYGLSRNTGIIANAKFHQANYNSVIITMDIESFFPSISYKLVKDLFLSIGFSKECSEVLTKLSTLDKRLPQGAPCSSHIASLVFSKVDSGILQYCKSRHIKYSRYIDDITLSGDEIHRNDCKRIVKIINKAGFKINTSKTRVFGREEVKTINNIVLQKESLTVTDEYKNSILQMYKEHNKDYSIKSNKSLYGKISFYRYVNRIECGKFCKQNSISTI